MAAVAAMAAATAAAATALWRCPSLCSEPSELRLDEAIELFWFLRALPEVGSAAISAPSLRPHSPPVFAACNGGPDGGRPWQGSRGLPQWRRKVRWQKFAADDDSSSLVQFDAAAYAFCVARRTVRWGAPNYIRPKFARLSRGLSPHTRRQIR